MIYYSSVLKACKVVVWSHVAAFSMIFFDLRRVVEPDASDLLLRLKAAESCTDSLTYMIENGFGLFGVGGIGDILVHFGTLSVTFSHHNSAR